MTKGTYVGASGKEVSGERAGLRHGTIMQQQFRVHFVVAIPREDNSLSFGTSSLASRKNDKHELVSCAWNIYTSLNWSSWPEGGQSTQGAKRLLQNERGGGWEVGGHLLHKAST